MRRSRDHDAVGVKLEFSILGTAATGGPEPGELNWCRGGPLAVYEEEALSAVDALGSEIPRDAVLRAWDDGHRGGDYNTYVFTTTDFGGSFRSIANNLPKGEVARRYGVYRSQDGTSERALFVVDREGVVSWSYVSPVGVNPGADGILRALEELESGAAP